MATQKDALEQDFDREIDSFVRLTSMAFARATKPKRDRSPSEQSELTALIRAALVWADMSGLYHPDEMFWNVHPKLLGRVRALAKKERV